MTVVNPSPVPTPVVPGEFSSTLEAPATKTVGVGKEVVPEFEFEISESGIWQISYQIDAICEAAGGDCTFVLLLNGEELAGAVWNSPGVGKTQVPLIIAEFFNAGDILTLQVQKTGGTYKVRNFYTRITAARLS